MATITSPQIFSVLTSSNENNEDFLDQLRDQMSQIENNFRQKLTQIQERTSFNLLKEKNNEINGKVRTRFFDVLKELASQNNLPFDEKMFREQIFDEKETISLPHKDVVPKQIPIINENPEQHLSPMNNNRRSQFAPVLSSTPVHQTSPIMSNPVDSNMATPSVATTLVVNTCDLPAVPPSAIVPQRANLTRAGANRPPRVPRAESASRQKKNPSPIKEQQNETEIVITREVHLTSRRRIRSKQNLVEENVEVFVERNDEIIKTVQATPLRGRKKKQIEPESIEMVQCEPNPMPIENELPTKPSRTGRSKKKETTNVEQPVRSSSVRQRKKQEIQIAQEQIPSSPPKKTTRSRKKTDQQTEETAPISKVRATPSRGKKKPPVEVEPPIVSLSPKITSTRSKKRKEKDEQNSTPIDTIQPPSPKRRAARRKKSVDLPKSPAVEILDPPEEKIVSPVVVPVRRSRRGKKETETVEEKQEAVVLKKKTRAGRAKKTEDSVPLEIPVTVVDIDVDAVDTNSSKMVSSKSIDSLMSKPPRPPVARKKKSIAMPQICQSSPTTPPKSAQRIESTSPINDKPLLPIPVVGSRRRAAQKRDVDSSPTVTDPTLDVIPSTSRNKKRTRSSMTDTPKRARRENLVLNNVLGTPGKKRRKCTCEKRRNKICDICAAAVDA